MWGVGLPDVSPTYARFATTDLSLIQGQGDITINPTNASRGILT